MPFDRPSTSGALQNFSINSRSNRVVPEPATLVAPATLDVENPSLDPNADTALFIRSKAPPEDIEPREEEHKERATAPSLYRPVTAFLNLFSRSKDPSESIDPSTLGRPTTAPSGVKSNDRRSHSGALATASGIGSNTQRSQSGALPPVRPSSAAEPVSFAAKSDTPSPSSKQEKVISRLAPQRAALQVLEEDKSLSSMGPAPGAQAFEADEPYLPFRVLSPPRPPPKREPPPGYARPTAASSSHLLPPPPKPITVEEAQKRSNLSQQSEVHPWLTSHQRANDKLLETSLAKLQKQPDAPEEDIKVEHFAGPIRLTGAYSRKREPAASAEKKDNDNYF